MFDRLIAAARAAGRRLRPDGDLAAQTVRSGVWAGGTNVGTRALQIASVVVLARILGPEAFGLMGLALLAYEGVDRVSDPGIDRALIQRREADVDRYLDTAWTVRFLRGVGLAAILALGAPFVATLFGEPRLTTILYAVALSPVVSGCLNPGVLYFQKDLDLHKTFVYELSSAAANFGVAVAAAVVYGSVWALVLGFLAADVARVVASYALHEYRPRPRFRPGQVRELFGYGRWVTGASAVAFLLTSGDDALVGFLLSTAVLGYYRLGYRFGKTPTLEVSRSLSAVAFPLYSKLQGDAAALAAALRRTVRLIAFVAFPTTVGVVVTAPLFVRGVLGTQWLPAVGVLQVVAVASAFAALTSVFNDVWDAIGRPDYNAKIKLVRLVATGVVIYPATVEYGIEGTAVAMACVFVLLVVPLKFAVLCRSVAITYRQLLSELWYPAAASGVMGIVLLGLGRLQYVGSSIVEFAASVAVGVVVYLSVVVVVEAYSGWQIGRDVHTVLDAVRG